MKKTSRKRLTLDRDTVKTLVELSSSELPHIRGGVLVPGPIHPLSTGSSTQKLDVAVALC